MANNDGVVYTKKWVVELILDLVGFTADKPLWKMKALEPSCGGGSFLSVITERIAISAIRDKAFCLDEIRDCVIAFDTSETSAAASRAVVASVLEDYGFDSADAATVARQWIHCEDYLLSAPLAVDFVVGNPPYVRATDLPRTQREEYCSRYQTMTMGCDIYVAFIERGLMDLRAEGKLCFICADRWLQNQYGSALRKFVASQYHISAVVKMHDVDAFEKQVSAYPAIILLDKSSGAVKYANCNEEFNQKGVDELLEWMHSGQSDYSCSGFEAGLIPMLKDGAILPLTAPKKVRMVLELSNKFPPLEKTGVKLGIGLATGRDSVFISDNQDLVETERMLPVFNMRDWRRGKRDKQRWLINPWDADGSLICLDDYPLTKKYFEENRESLAKRHVAKKNPSNWFRTIDKPKWELLGTPMLLFPDMAGKAEPVYSDGSKYPCHNCYWLISDDWDLKVLGGLLMSEVAESFIDALGVKMRGGTLRFQAQYLRLIHVPLYSDLKIDVREALRAAFERGDRDAATKAAEKAYGI